MQQTADHPSHGLAVLHRSFDIDRINDLANHPEVRPFVGGDVAQPLDLSAAVQDDRNICLTGEHGGFILNWTSPGCYEVHTMILPEGRGPWARDAAQMAQIMLRDLYRVRQVWTRVKPSAGNVVAYTLAAGLLPCGRGVFDIGIGPEPFNLYERWL